MRFSWGGRLNSRTPFFVPFATEFATSAYDLLVSESCCRRRGVKDRRNRLLRRCLSLLLLSLCLEVALTPAVFAQGRVVSETLHSQALRGNVIGDTPDRTITIYLPPGYDRDASRRYPVVYLLHGATSDPKEWLDGTYQGLNLAAALDQRAGEAEYIVVMPHADNSFGGSFYVNSAAFGRWEDFVAKELVAFVDARFRTLPTRASRALVGQSMGGFGALYLAGRHSDTFGHVYAISACCLGFVGDLAADGERWRSTPRGWLRAMTAALAPSPLADAAAAPLPFVAGPEGRVREVDAVVRSWRQFLPLNRLTSDPAGYRRLCTIALEAGREDAITNVPLGTAAFSRELTRLGIPHTLDEFTGGHTDRTRERFTTAVLPFLARVLATEERPGACATR